MAVPKKVSEFMEIMNVRLLRGDISYSDYFATPKDEGLYLDMILIPEQELFMKPDFFPGLTNKERVLLGVVIWLSRYSGKCTPTNRQLGELFEVKKGTISRRIRKLKEAGFIRVELLQDWDYYHHPDYPLRTIYPCFTGADYLMERMVEDEQETIQFILHEEGKGTKGFEVLKKAITLNAL